MKKIIVSLVLIVTTQFAACSSAPDADSNAGTAKLQAQVDQIKRQVEKLNRMEPDVRRMVSMESDLKALIAQLSVITESPVDALPEAESSSNVQMATIQKVDFTQDNTAKIADPVSVPAEYINNTEKAAPKLTAVAVSNSEAEIKQQVKAKYSLQLASIRNEESLDKTWNSIRSKHEDLMADWQPVFETAVVSNITYFRVKAGEFTDYQTARSNCDSVRALGTNCIVSKVENSYE